MPWKESSVMDERIRFVIRLKDGESMAALCREFGMSRKTGYKIFERYEECASSYGRTSKADPGTRNAFWPVRSTLLRLAMPCTQSDE